MNRSVTLFSFVGVLLAITGSFALWQGSQTDWSRFDKALWVSQADVEPLENRRSGMLNDLETRLKPGMSREEIIALMGEPDRRTDQYFYYGLGVPDFSIDYDNFELQFDTQGKLVGFRYIQG